jgi:hypothetical protein
VPFKDPEKRRQFDRERAKRVWDKMSEEERSVLRERCKTYYQNNKEHVAQRRKEYKQNNRGRVNEHIARRQAAKKQATPKWVSKEDRDKMVIAYKEARRLTELTGISFHVDHYYPLSGETVCGLHVHNNLQILPWYDNNAKYNKHPEELNG